MRTWSFPSLLALACGALLCGSLPAAAQSDLPFTSHKYVFGYQDAKTGVFHPTPLAIPDGASDPIISGQIWLTITVSLTTPLPSGDEVGCEMDVHVEQSETVSPFASTGYDEEAFGVATVSGATATCLVKIPYSWTFPSSSSTSSSLTGSYVVEMGNAAANAPQPTVLRLSSGNFLSTTTIPPTGTKSTFSVSARL